jgi:hypothetical protein
VARRERKHEAGGFAVLQWQWSGDESKTESSRGGYKLARVMPNIFVGMWLLLILMDIAFLFRAPSFWPSFLLVLFGPFLFMGSLVWGIRYLAYRYVSVVKITPDGLAVTRGANSSLHPWSTIGEIRTVPFVHPALWAVKFRDGSPTVAFFTEGASFMLFGWVKAKSALVDEIRRLTSVTSSEQK